MQGQPQQPIHLSQQQHLTATATRCPQLHRLLSCGPDVSRGIRFDAAGLQRKREQCAANENLVVSNAAIAMYHRQTNLPKLIGGTRQELEAGVGFEPTHRSFADSRLTTWLTRPMQGAQKIPRAQAPRHCKTRHAGAVSHRLGLRRKDDDVQVQHPVAITTIMQINSRMSVRILSSTVPSVL